MKRKLKCSVCGAKFYPINTYVVYEAMGALQTLSQPTKTYDAVDCLNCGCQKLLGVRMPKVQNDLGGDEK